MIVSTCELKETDEIMKQNIIFHHLGFVDQLVVVLMRFGSVPDGDCYYRTGGILKFPEFISTSDEK